MLAPVRHGDLRLVEAQVEDQGRITKQRDRRAHTSSDVRYIRTHLSNNSEYDSLPVVKDERTVFRSASHLNGCHIPQIDRARRIAPENKGSICSNSCDRLNVRTRYSRRPSSSGPPRISRLFSRKTRTTSPIVRLRSVSACGFTNTSTSRCRPPDVICTLRRHRYRGRRNTQYLVPGQGFQDGDFHPTDKAELRSAHLQQNPFVHRSRSNVSGVN